MRSVLLLLAVLLLLPTAQAELGRGVLDVELPAHAAGAVTATSEGALLFEDGALEATFVGSGTLERVIHRAFGYVHPDEPGFETTWYQRTQREALHLEDALLRLDETRPHFRLLASDTDVTFVPDDARIGALGHDKTVRLEWERAIGVRVNPGPAHEEILQAGLHQVHAEEGDASADGPMRLFVTGAKLTLQNDGKTETLKAHFRTEERPGSIYNPLEDRWFGPGTHTEYVQEYLLATVDGHLATHFVDRPALFYSERPSLAIDGTALLPAATGTLRMGEDTHTLSGQDLMLEGRFTLTAHGASGSRGTFEADGDFTVVSYGAVTAQYDWATVVVAGLGTLLLAGLAWATTKMGFMVGYARVSGQEILEHPGRSEVYDRVKSQPGINFHELEGQIEFGASTLTYHLRVLERNGYVTRLKDGRYVRFFDRQSGAYSGERKNAVSALQNATTARIADAIRHRPGLAQCDLAQRFGIAASTVSWHIQRLVSAGLVEKQRDAHYTRYYMGPAWATMPQEIAA